MSRPGPGTTAAPRRVQNAKEARDVDMVALGPRPHTHSC